MVDALAIGAVIVLVAAALVAISRGPRRARERLAALGVQVQGEVLGVWQDGTGSYCVRYRYTPKGAAEPITRDEFAGCLRARLPEVGEHISVRYDPRAPRRAHLQRSGC